MSDQAALRPKLAFVVDDEVDARQMIGDYLTMQGFSVVLCEGGANLRSALTCQTPDIVILDLNMREEDGLALVRFLRQTSAVPIILLTATASPIDRVVGLEMGADDYVTKPCELRELLARIRSVLRRSSATTARDEERRLAAIVSLDLVGYGRAVQIDEQATLAAVRRTFSEIIDPSLPRHRGYLFKKLGDGALIEFASVINAVDWSIAFQQTVFDLPKMVVGGASMTFRVGVAIGDVVAADNDRFGESVALAVRIQEVAQAGAVAISEFAYRLVCAHVSEQFAHLGIVPLKNIEQPMGIWTWTPRAV